MINAKVVQMHDSEDKDKTYADPEMAKIILEQIAALKERIALAEEQLNLLTVENTQ